MKKYLWKIKGFIAAGIFFNLLEAVLTSTLLLFPGLLIDNYHKGPKYVFHIVSIYVIIFTVFLVEEYFFNRTSDYRRIKFEKNIKKDYFDSAIYRDFREFHQYDTEEYISMQANDITEMCQSYLSPLFSIYRSLLLIITFGISLILFVNFYVAAVILLFSVIVIFVPRLTADQLAKRNKAYLNQVGKYTTAVRNLLESHDILDSKGRKAISELHEKKLKEVLSSNMTFRRTNSLSMVINGGAVEFVSVITLIIVAILLYNNRITVGMATIAFTYSTKFMEPIYELNICLGKVHSVKLVQEKLMKIIDATPDTKPAPSSKITAITTTELHKSYENISIHIPRTNLNFPKKYLITGENGAGKSVFLKLLLQFEKPDVGSVKYDNEAVADITDAICYVPQNAVIFDAPYEDNVTIYHTYDASEISTYESYFPSNIICNIKANPDPQSLSGGEKQILSIIRALCSHKRIILMDEPFSAMNPTAIHEFMQNIHKINSMIVIVAHNIDDYKGLFDEEIRITR